MKKRTYMRLKSQSAEQIRQPYTMNRQPGDTNSSDEKEKNKIEQTKNKQKQNCILFDSLLNDP